MRSRTINGCLLFVFGLICATYAQIEDACSPNQYLECVDEANCTIINEAGDWECVCTEGNGDGLRNGTGCGLPKCRWDSDCHPHAVCVSETCQCQPGYAGDGLVGENRTGCNDVDECASSPCHTKASCHNNDGSFVCICNATAGYTGDGFNCSHTCSVDDDCEDDVEHCVAFECVCNTGYHYRPGTVICENTNECELELCDPNATCTDTLGSYTCECNEGFYGDGVSCTELPRNCHDILSNDPTAESAEYDINPDGPGPLPTTRVECDMRPGLGITIFHVTTSTYKFKRTRSTFNINYVNSVDHIKSVIDQSNYCTQEESYTCKYGAILMNGNSYQIDGNDVPQFNWGGSYISNTCACGLLGYCNYPFSTCNCDGSSATNTDNGKLTKKALLPIKKVVNQINSGVGIATIGPVKCAPKTFDVPVDCHDAKFNISITKSGPQILDVDGPDGPLDPILAHCDMETYKHAGVTIIPPLSRIPVEPTEPGQNNITYTTDVNAMKKLVERSHFCYQEGGYRCNNSRLLNNGDKKGWLTDLDGNDLDYFFGGLGNQWSCGCDITGTCASDDFGCNCDVNDGQLRSDYGRALKPDVPIGSVTLTEIGPGHYGEYYISPLMCSQREFGIHATCDGYQAEDYNEDHTFLIDPDGPADPDEDEENEDMFPAYCEFHKDPDYAVTVIHTNKDSMNETFNNGFESWYYYRMVSTSQLEVLTARALYCTQVISYTCEFAPIHDAEGEPVLTWKTKDGTTMAYFAGTGEYNICECAITHSCENDMACNCDMDDAVQRRDDGLLLNKDDLPVMSVNTSYIGTGGEAIVSVGPLKCYDLFPNCYYLRRHTKYYRLDGEPPKKDGLNTIDPDGAGGVEPFVVNCDGYITRVPVDPEDPPVETTSNSSSPVTNCYEIHYAVDGHEVTPEQIQALVDHSDYCTQTIIMDCLNAPITDRVYYSKCDGQQIDGWSGSNAEDKCDCGVVNGCVNGEQCNCDVVDGVWRSDGSIVYDKELLPACEVCITLDSAENITTDPKQRTAQ